MVSCRFSLKTNPLKFLIRESLDDQTPRGSFPLLLAGMATSTFSRGLSVSQSAITSGDWNFGHGQLNGNHGKIMGKSWENHGKCRINMENPWGYHGNMVQKPSFMGFIPDLSIKYRNYY